MSCSLYFVCILFLRQILDYTQHAKTRKLPSLMYWVVPRMSNHIMSNTCNYLDQLELDKHTWRIPTILLVAFVRFLSIGTYSLNLW